MLPTPFPHTNHGELFYSCLPAPIGVSFLHQENGKLHPSILSNTLLQHLGTRDNRVLVGPRIGEDAAIIKNNGNVLVIHSDPITGTSQDLGRLAIHVSVNDVVSKGADPRWISLVLLLDAKTTMADLRKISAQAHQASLEVGAAIIGGHTEVTSAIKRSLIVSTVVGEAPEGGFFTSSGACHGDHIIMTKTAALEGTAILARDLPRLRRELGGELVNSALDFFSNISVYPEARIAREVPSVTAMHDVTEGGVLCGVQEVASASGCGFIVDAAKIPIAHETRRICSTLKLDPLKTIGSGSLIITISESKANFLIQELQKDGIRATDIGKITERGQLLKRENGNLRVPSFVREEIWKIL